MPHHLVVPQLEVMAKNCFLEGQWNILEYCLEGYGLNVERLAIDVNPGMWQMMDL